MVLSATDQGGENIRPFTGSATKMLSNNTADLGQAIELNGYSKMNYNGANLLMVPKEPAHFALANIDMTDISSLMIVTASTAPVTEKMIFEIRLDSPTGTKIGEATFKQGPPAANQQGPIYSPFMVPITGAADGKMHQLFITSKTKSGGDPGTFILAGITFNAK